MDQLMDLITSENFVYFTISVVLSLVVGWFISSHFSNPKRMSTFKLAQRYGKTDFGTNRNIAIEPEDEIYNDPFLGKLIIKGNGTWIDTENQLMWIRAPWGMIWDGENFIGNPIKLSWYEATDLFGKGVYLKRRGTDFNYEDNGKLKHNEGYTKGNCIVDYVEYCDWRLPTAFEMNTLRFYDKQTEENLYKNSKSQKSRMLREKMFPVLKGFENYSFWTADPGDNNTSWAIDRYAGQQDLERKFKYFILFVRKLKTNDMLELSHKG